MSYLGRCSMTGSDIASWATCDQFRDADTDIARKRIAAADPIGRQEGIFA